MNPEEFNKTYESLRKTSSFMKNEGEAIAFVGGQLALLNSTLFDIGRHLEGIEKIAEQILRAK